MGNSIGGLTRISWQSVRIKLIAGVLLIIAPLIVLLIYSNFYAIDVVRNQVAESNKNMMSLYMQQFDRSLQTADEYLLSLFEAGAGLTDLEYANSEYDQYSAVRRLRLSVTNTLLYNPTLDGFFILSTSKEEYISAFHPRTTLEERFFIRNHVEQENIMKDSAASFYHRG